MSDRWIVVRNWDKFQHYGNRKPTWIKVYPELLYKDEYLQLTEQQQLLLHKLWMLYAISGRKVSENTSTLSRKLGQRVLKKSLEALNHAGFIDFVASEALAERYQDASPEVEVLRTSTKRAASARRRSGARGRQNSVCPECGTGAGFHAVDCSVVQA